MTTLFIDYELVNWMLRGCKGDLPVPHIKALKLSSFKRKIEKSRTELVYDITQLHWVDSFDEVYLCCHTEELLEEWARKIPEKKMLYLDSELDWQVETMDVDETLYADMLSKLFFDRKISADRLIWHASASLVSLGDNDSMSNLFELCQKSKNYILFYDWDFFYRDDWHVILQSLEQNGKKYRFIQPIDIDDIGTVQDAVFISGLAHLKSKFILTSSIDNEKRFKILALNTFKSQEIMFFLPDFAEKECLAHWVDCFNFTVSTYTEIIKLKGICKIVGELPKISPLMQSLVKNFIVFANKGINNVSFYDFLNEKQKISKMGKHPLFIDYEFFVENLGSRRTIELLNEPLNKEKEYY